MRPDPSHQNRPLTLVITPGLNHPFRLAYAGGTYFEVLSEFPTWEAARDARDAAVDAINVTEKQ